MNTAVSDWSLLQCFTRSGAVEVAGIERRGRVCNRSGKLLWRNSELMRHEY